MSFPDVLGVEPASEEERDTDGRTNALAQPPVVDAARPAQFFHSELRIA